MLFKNILHIFVLSVYDFKVILFYSDDFYSLDYELVLNSQSLVVLCKNYLPMCLFCRY